MARPEKNTPKASMERAYRETKERLRFAIESAGIGTWDYDPETGVLFWDDRCRELCGLQTNKPVSYDLFLESILPEDREKTNAAVQSAMQGKNNGEYEVEYRTIGIDDMKPRWLRSKGKSFFNNDGVPYRFIGTVLDITHQVLHEQETEELLQKRDEFMNIASHELKTPITGLKMALQIIEKMVSGPEHQLIHSFVLKANRQMARLVAILKSLMDVTRVKEGNLILNKSLYDIKEVIENRSSELFRSFNTHNIILGGDNVALLFDKDRIDQVINNLVTNAIKYSPQANKIYINIKSHGDTVMVSVSDLGIGIPADKLSKVFDRYFRVETTSKHFPGVGLGLYISAGIIRQHGGDIGVDSAPGKGSTFWFTLPIEAID
jgi:two-component system CheB/CheR fusion protein